DEEERGLDNVGRRRRRLEGGGGRGGRTKSFKVNLVRDWLLKSNAGSNDTAGTTTTTTLRIEDGNALNVAQAFVHRGRRIRPIAEALEMSNVAMTTKKDDLADCLLQGMAWLKWEQNKSLLSQGKFDELLSQ